MAHDDVIRAYKHSQLSESHEQEGDFWQASFKSQQAADHLNRAKNCTSDARALEALSFLNQHYSNHSQFLQSIHHISQQQQQHHLIDSDVTTPTSASTTASLKSSLKNKFKLTIDSTYIEDSTNQAREAEMNMYTQFHELFIEPWQLYWNNHLQHETDSAQVKQTYFQTIHHTERNLNILLQIANLSNISPTTPNSVVLPVTGKRISAEEEKDMIKHQEELALRLKSLYSNLSTVQVTRLEKRVQELENLLQQEKVTSSKLEKELEEVTDRWNSFTSHALQRQKKHSS
jgi:hypothetical protein